MTLARHIIRIHTALQRVWIRAANKCFHFQKIWLCAAPACNDEKLVLLLIYRQTVHNVHFRLIRTFNTLATAELLDASFFPVDTNLQGLKPGNPNNCTTTWMMLNHLHRGRLHVCLSVSCITELGRKVEHGLRKNPWPRVQCTSYLFTVSYFSLNIHRNGMGLHDVLWNVVKKNIYI